MNGERTRNSARSNEDLILHKEIVADVRGAMLDDRLFDRLAETFRAMGYVTRLKILYALSRRELCVGDLAGLLDMTPSAVSHQLRILRNLRLVKNRKEGKIIYYSLDNGYVMELLDRGLERIKKP